MDEQTFLSLSQGEKQRISLSLLFAWRDVAKIKNSIDTNLLILDETFDTSLDIDGTENLMIMLDMLQRNTNIFVISHKGAMLEDRLNHQLRFSKKNNFTVMEKL